MNLLLALPSLDQIVQVAIVVLALILVLAFLRIVLQVAMRVITIGCALIFLLGLALAALYYFDFIG